MKVIESLFFFIFLQFKLMKAKVNIENSWKSLLREEFKKKYFNEISQFVRTEYKIKTIFPEPKNIFNAFNSTPVSNVKVVILGQDPYHGSNQAHGLSFSVLDGVAVPPSLKNIYKEISIDLGIAIPDSGNLQKWANQGVFLLNSILTVEKGKPNSHKKCGWSIFTSRVIELLSTNREGIVFLLWGKVAQLNESLIDHSKHLVLKAPHPSPLSAYSGFFGCRHFSKANKYLRDKGISEVDWRIK